ncbi:hypothetical protein AVEN_265448-1 [Araneus ventricosus]|uniref:Uncharacterized protein n=1 Tax=Araneus ventricosus TaxID=182803 RepID=A0A4Y2CHH7_ARAVE|nr:hypothetical protein AVEN_265448-1 [Araneus ventricosus]
MGLLCYQPTNVPLLTWHHHYLHLQWACEQYHWKQWKSVASQTKAEFSCIYIDGMVNKLAREQLPGQSTANTTLAGSGSIIDSITKAVSRSLWAVTCIHGICFTK